MHFLITMGILVIAIGLHEYGHAKFADLAGDPTPRMMGRVTLNPIKHLDPFGTIFMVISSIIGIGIGWGKPVMVRPDKMRNPRWDHFVSVLAGPMMNMLLAIFFALIMRLLITLDMTSSDILMMTLLVGVQVNVGLFVFNLIPIGPLDGHWLVGAFMPEPMQLKWYQFNRGIGSMIFLILVLVPRGSELDVLSRFFYPIVMRISFFLLGVPQP